MYNQLQQSTYSCDCVSLYFSSIFFFTSFITIKETEIKTQNLISSFRLSTVGMVVPIRSILKQSLQYLTQFLIKLSCLVLWHCITLESLSQGRLMCMINYRGVRKTMEISFRILYLQPRFKLCSSQMLEMLPLCKHSVIKYTCTPLLSYKCWHSLNSLQVLPISIKLKHIYHTQFHAF